jgi:hypothetical protein
MEEPQHQPVSERTAGGFHLDRLFLNLWGGGFA